MYNQSYGPCGGFGRGRRSFPGSFAGHFGSMPVNIEEQDDHFMLTVFAPALQKDKIRISAKDDVLTIAYNGTREPGQEGRKFTRREYHNDSFERSFSLNGKVELDRISAVYAEGVLTVRLPKNAEASKPEQRIEVE